MKTFERLLLAAGAAVLVVLIHRIGLGSIAGQLARLGPWFAVVLSVQGGMLALDTIGWRLTLPAPARTDRFASMFQMRLIGDAVNYLTPSASLGGELVRFRLLSRTQPQALAASSVVLMVVDQFLSQALFVLAGIPFVIAATGHHALPWSGALAPLAAMVAALLAGLLFLGRRGEALQLLHRAVRRLGSFPDQGGGHEGPWREIDRRVFGAFRERPRDMLLSVGCFFVAWSLGIGECVFVLGRLGHPLSWSRAAAIESLSVLVETGLFFVPAKMGTQEGGKYFIFLVLGLDPSLGFAFGVTRRIRELAWGALGLALFGREQRRDATRWAAPAARSAPFDPLDRLDPGKPVYSRP